MKSSKIKDSILKNISEPRVNIILTAISTLAAVISIFIAITANRQSAHSVEIAERANKIAEQANEIAKEENFLVEQSQLPDVSILYLFTFRDYGDEFKRPCRLESGTARWDIEFASVFDISNLGGKVTSLVNIQTSNHESFVPEISLSVDYDYFGSRDAFNSWIGQRGGPGSRWVEHPQTQFEFGGLPLKIAPGETVRLVIKGKERSFIDAELTPDEVHHLLLDVNWNSQLTFEFADGTTRNVDLRIIKPYEFDPRSLAPRPFELCENF